MKEYFLIRPPLEEVIPSINEEAKKIVLDRILTHMLPYGLLKIGSYLKSQGHCVKMFDFSPPFSNMNADELSELKLHFQEYRWAGNEHTKKKYPCFLIGDSFADIKNILEKESPPDEIYITSSMTFHAKSIAKTIDICKEIFPDTKVVLGGIYPTVCEEHAKKFTKADEIFKGPHWEAETYDSDLSLLSYSPENHIFKFSRGCPNNCSYCAVPVIEGKRPFFREPKHIANEIIESNRIYGIKKFSTWESNPLMNKGYFEKILDILIENDRDIELEAPEALDPSKITPDLAKKMYRSGFNTVFLPLESSSDETNLQRFHRRTKITDFDNAVANLTHAGVLKKNIIVFCIAALPNQDLNEMLNDVFKVWRMCLRLCINFFTPIPKTEEYKKNYSLIMNKDIPDLHPLLFPFAGKTFSCEDMEDLIFLQDTVHPLQNIHLLSKSGNVKKNIIERLYNETSLRRHSLQMLLHDFLDDTEVKIIKGIVKRFGLNILLIHFLMKNFDSYGFHANRYNKEFFKKFKNFIENLQRKGITIKDKFEEFKANAPELLVDLFSCLYMTKSEINDYLKSITKNRKSCILRFWSNRSKYFQSRFQYSSNVSMINSIFSTNKKDLFHLIQEHKFKTKMIKERGDFIYTWIVPCNEK